MYADEELWLGRGPQSPSSINTLRDGAFRSQHAPYRLDFTNISQVLGATQDLIKEGVYGAEFDKQLRYRAAHQVNVKNVLEVLPDPDNRIAYARTNPRLTRFQRDRNTVAPGSVDIQTYESVVEVDYGAQIAPRFALRPNLQYVIHPDGTGKIPDAFVIGLYTQVTF